MFNEVKSSLDLQEVERSVLAFWENERIFDKLREKNRGGRPWSFIDGPITANNPMGVHHAWGRIYKDIYQRFKAMQGHELRYQNGFDCHGLWVEVEVEKELGINSKHEIADYGLDRFIRRCRERVDRYSSVQTEQSKRLGQWMDWDNSYYTMSDSNIEHIWHFLKVCHEKGWLYRGKRAMPWCARCGTSLSQHELADSYKDLIHKSVYV
ncbi:MAG TPA: class I tRNA ligase family protein, partial [Armatimonadota bacterium]|nr:class I tRNA ligase family protein [Armatimonadota bacterium]